MARCPDCNTEIVPGSRFCSGCGKPLFSSCPDCDAEIGVWMAFCPYCGHKVGQAPTTQTSSDSNVRLATVLFGDVKGFTAMSEHLPPEEVTNIMNHCFELLSQPIVQYGGTIDKYVGDAIMARFGAPQAHEDDPVRAIHAALEMQRALKAFAEELKATRGFDLAMRIGINTGQVLAGEVGSAALKQFTLMGNTVNLASRLEHEAEPGSVLVGESTYRLSKHAFEFQAMPPMEIRGQSELINAFVPLRPRAVVPSSRAERTGRRLKLIGREAELEQLDAYLAESRTGQGRLVALVADPGVGKSRLAEEFRGQHTGDGVVMVYAAAPSFGESMPYSMLTSFIRSLVFGDLEDREISGDELRDRMIAMLPERSVNDAVAILADILGVAVVGGTDVSQMEARSRQAMLTNILKILLAAQGQQQVVLVTLEDMHWADSASLDVFDQILTGIQSLRVMVLMTHRPHFSRAWSRMAFYRQITLQELSPEDATHLLAEFLGSFDLPEVVAERVMEKAGGNPFFLEQLMNNLVESGAVVRQGDRWIPAGDVTLAVPDTIQEILLARIDQLPRGPRQVLEVAAVIGRTFLYRLLQAVIEHERTIDANLQTLTEQEFIYERAVLPELEYMFKHSLTHDVVYNGLLEARRRTLHERVARAIEELGITQSGESLPLLAVHYEKTANREKALEYAIAAGDRARGLYANQDALTHYRQALELLEAEPDGHDPRKVQVLEALGDVSQLVGEHEEAQAQYMRALDIASNASIRGRLWRKLGDLAQSRGRYAEAVTSYREAEDALQEVDDPAEQVNIWLAQARMDRSRGALDSASATCLRALSLASRVDDATGASLHFELGEIERERGHLRSASGYLDAAAGEWAKEGAREKEALAESALAEVVFRRGQLAEALRHLDSALEIQQRVLDRPGMALSLFRIGRTRMAMGEVEEARECFDQAIAIASEIDDRLLVANAKLQLSLISLDQGELEQARELVGQAYSEFKLTRNWRGSAIAMRVRARLFRAEGDVERARSNLRRAANLAEEMSDPWLQAQVNLGGAELEEEVGRLDVAAENAAAAASMARDLSDVLLVARAERVLGRVRYRQGRRREALTLLANSVETLRRCGAQVDAGRAALDFAIAAHGMPSGTRQTGDDMLRYALTTFEQTGATRDLGIAQAIAQRLRSRQAFVGSER